MKITNLTNKQLEQFELLLNESLAGIDFVKDCLNEIMLIDARACRLVSFIIKSCGEEALQDQRIRDFIDSYDIEPEYSILVEWVMQLKGLKKSPLDDLIECSDNKEFGINEIKTIIPNIDEIVNKIIRTNIPVIHGGMFINLTNEIPQRIMIKDTLKNRNHEAVFVIR